MDNTHPTLILAQDLIRRPSITPLDAGCQEHISAYLASLGFISKHLPFGEVKNLWIRHGTAQPLLVFVGHTDVVPPGPLENWTTLPFGPNIREGYLYGRGAADMKGSLAAMVIACEQFITEHPDYKGSIALLITSDEEGPAQDGTQKVVKYLQTQNEDITWCIVGEPSSEKRLGDTIKIGRRGSLNGTLTVYGKQGHIAYPHLAKNPIHHCLAALTELCARAWDTGHELFPPTSFQISNIHAGTGVTNVIPQSIEIVFNFRYSPAVTIDELKQAVTTILDRYTLGYNIHWVHSASPFLTESGTLLTATQQAIQQITGIQPRLSTDGGTSDGRFLAPLGCELLELGPCNVTIHQVNECVGVTELVQLTQIYTAILEQLFL